MRAVRLGEWARFVRGWAHVLARQPALVFQQAANQPADGHVRSAAAGRLSSGRERRPWFRRAGLPEVDPTLLAIRIPIGVRALAPTPDGRRVVVAEAGVYGGGARVTAWSLDDGRPLGPIAGHAWNTQAVAVSPDGRWVASSGWVRPDGPAAAEFFLSPTGGGTPRPLSGHGGLVTACAFLSGGSTVAAHVADGTVCLWHAPSGRFMSATRVAPEPGLRIEGLQDNDTPFSADGRFLVTGEHIIEVTTGSRVDRPRPHDLGAVSAVALSPNGARIAYGHEGGEVSVWSVRTGARLMSARHGDDPRYRSASIGGTLSLAPVRACAFSPDGCWIASGAEDGTVQVREVANPDAVVILAGHTDGVRACTFLRTPGESLLTADRAAVRLWDWRAAIGVPPRQGHDKAIHACVFGPGADRLLTTSMDGSAKLWSAEAVRHLATLREHDVPTLRVTSPDAPEGARPREVEVGIVVGDGDTVVTAGWRVVRWRAADGRPTDVFGDPGHRLLCRLSSDGRSLLVGSGGSGVAPDTLVRWPLAGGAPPVTLVTHPGMLVAAECSPDGRHVASAARPDRRFALSAALGRSSFSIRRQLAGGRVLACEGRDYQGETLVVDLERGALAGGVLHLADRPVRALAFSPDGRRLLHAADGPLAEWTSGLEREVRRFTAAGADEDATYSPDGRHVLSGRSLIDTATGTVARVFSGLARWRGFTGDGRYVLGTLEADGEEFAGLWDVRAGGGPACLMYAGDCRALAFGHGRRLLAQGGATGRLSIWEALGLAFGSPIVTAVRMFDAERSRREEAVTGACAWCGRRFAVPAPVLAAIDGLAAAARLEPDQSPCANLPRAAWEEPALEGSCPLCDRPLRFNPFVADSSGA